MIAVGPLVPIAGSVGARGYDPAVKLDKRQRKQIVEALREGGLLDADCRPTETDDAIQIRHVPTRSLFTLSYVDGSYRGSYEVGDLGFAMNYDTPVWSTVPDRVKGWARDVKADADLPDLWAELLSAREAPGSSYADAENAPLSPAEQAQVVKLLSEVREEVRRTYALTEAQSLALEAGLAEVR